MFEGHRVSLEMVKLFSLAGGSVAVGVGGVLAFIVNQGRPEEDVSMYVRSVWACLGPHEFSLWRERMAALGPNICLREQSGLRTSALASLDSEETPFPAAAHLQHICTPDPVFQFHLLRPSPGISSAEIQSISSSPYTRSLPLDHVGTSTPPGNAP